MFNPLHPFEPRFVDMFRSKGVKAFVKQTYTRGRPDFNENNLEGFVLIHFDTLLAAQQYYDVLKEDPGRGLFQLDAPADLEKINELLHTAKVFTMLTVKDAEIKARKVLDKKIKAFIEHKLNWHPSRQDEVIFSIDVQFGVVYALLKFRSKEIKVTLAEIETGKDVL